MLKFAIQCVKPFFFRFLPSKFTFCSLLRKNEYAWPEIKIKNFFFHSHRIKFRCRFSFLNLEANKMLASFSSLLVEMSTMFFFFCYFFTPGFIEVFLSSKICCRIWPHTYFILSASEGNKKKQFNAKKLLRLEVTVCLKQNVNCPVEVRGNYW